MVQETADNMMDGWNAVKQNSLDNTSNLSTHPVLALSIVAYRSLELLTSILKQ